MKWSSHGGSKLRVISFWAFCVTRCQRVILNMTRWIYLRQEKNFKANRCAFLYLFQTIFKSFLNCALPLHYLYVACLSSAQTIWIFNLFLFRIQVWLLEWCRRSARLNQHRLRYPLWNADDTMLFRWEEKKFFCHCFSMPWIRSSQDGQLLHSDLSSSDGSLTDNNNLPEKQVELCNVNIFLNTGSSLERIAQQIHVF